MQWTIVQSLKMCALCEDLHSSHKYALSSQGVLDSLPRDTDGSKMKLPPPKGSHSLANREVGYKQIQTNKSDDF